MPSLTTEVLLALGIVTSLLAIAIFGQDRFIAMSRLVRYAVLASMFGIAGLTGLAIYGSLDFMYRIDHGPSFSSVEMTPPPSSIFPPVGGTSPET